jgi:hypothetical protein
MLASLYQVSHCSLSSSLVGLRSSEPFAQTAKQSVGRCCLCGHVCSAPHESEVRAIAMASTRASTRHAAAGSVAYMWQCALLAVRDANRRGSHNARASSLVGVVGLHDPAAAACRLLGRPA